MYNIQYIIHQTGHWLFMISIDKMVETFLLDKSEPHRHEAAIFSKVFQNWFIWMNVLIYISNAKLLECLM